MTFDFETRSRQPLRVMFIITSMPVGGAETLLFNLVRRLDPERFAPEVCCLKEPGPLGEALAAEVPVFSNLLKSKYDVRILPRLVRLLKRRRIDAVITVGAGDKMFWGRLAAWRAGVPVVLSALHSTGWPDSISRMNRWLTPITDGFIAVAGRHGAYRAETERLPKSKVRVIHNGVDLERFQAKVDRAGVRAEFNCPAEAPLATIVAALRPEKNHDLLLEAAALVRQEFDDARFWIIGDGPERSRLEALTQTLGLSEAVTFLGTRHDIPNLLGASDALVLTSRMEANPVSILEAMAAAKPVVAPRVGSIPEVVCHGKTGLLFDAGSPPSVVARSLAELFADPRPAQRMGRAGQKRIASRWSLDHMVASYEDLITELHSAKRPRNLQDQIEPVEDEQLADVSA